MCLAIPARLLTLNADLTGRVDLQGSELPINCVFVPEAVRGDWLLVHAGFALRRLTQSDAAEIWSQWAELEQQVEASDVPA